MVRPQIIFAGGKPAFAVIRWKEFVQLAGDRAVAAMTDEEIYDAAKAAAEEMFPAEAIERQLKGESPVKVCRDYRGLTQAQLAKKTGLSPMYVSQIETGRRQGSLIALRVIAEALAVDLGDLLPPRRRRAPRRRAA